MKLKQIMTIGLSAAMILSAVPAETVVFAANEQTATADTANAESDIATESAEAGAAAFEAAPETMTSDDEGTDVAFTDSNDETTNNQTVNSEITNDQSANDETINNEPANDEIQIGEEQETSDESTIDESTVSDAAESVFDDNADIAAFSDESSEAADTEYGKEIYSETLKDETKGISIKWTFYESGTLVIENAKDGNGSTPDWSPWFNYKEKITDVIIEDGITTLGERNFMQYPALKTVTIKGTLSKIGNSVFEGSKEIENISVTGKTNNNGLKVIQLGECVFKDCTGLESAEFTGNFVTKKNAFEGCTSLKRIKVKESTMIMLGEYTFLNCSALIEADLPGSRMKSVGKAAFFDCTSLKQFDFSDVSRINESAFYNCSSLESIKIPDSTSTTTIEQFAFYGCSGLTGIEIPKNIKTIGKNAFWGCSGIKKLKIPGTVETISKSAFGKCTGLEELDIEEGVKTVEEEAFAACSGLNTMILPKSVSSFTTNFVTDYMPIKKICYRGTREEWNAANLNSDRFFNAKVYFEYGQDHKHQMITRTYTYPNSCTQPGRKETFCSICGYVESSEEILAGHHFSAWETVSEATVLAPAVQARTCSVCGTKETRNNGSKLTPTIKVTVAKFPLKFRQKTTVLKVSGLAKGDSIVSWKSSNTSIAKVNGRANGTSTITAGKKKGKATITVTLKSGLKKNITVTVQKTAVKTTKISGVAKKLKLKRKQSATLKPVIAPLTSLQKVTYKSSNKKVATVNSKGRITAKKKGTAVITVKSGSKTIKCKVTVK